MRTVALRLGRVARRAGHRSLGDRVGWALAALRVRAAEDRGQAAVELVAALPLVVLVAVAAGQALAAGAARELADHAAEAGAVALYESADPEDAARAALPGWARKRMTVRVDGGDVSVHLRPPAALPAVARLLEASSTAHAREAGS